MMPTLTRDTRLGGQELKRIVFSEDDVQLRIRELGGEITTAYNASDRLLVLGLLKGSFLFMADLVRAIELPLQVDFLVASSYGASKVSSGDVRLLYDPGASDAGTEDCVLAAVGAALGKMPKRARRDDAAVREAVRIAVRAAFRDSVGKKPVTTVHLVRL